MAFEWDFSDDESSVTNELLSGIDQEDEEEDVFPAVDTPKVRVLQSYTSEEVISGVELEQSEESKGIPQRPMELADEPESAHSEKSPDEADQLEITSGGSPEGSEVVEVPATQSEPDEVRDKESLQEEVARIRQTLDQLPKSAFSGNV